MSNEPYDWYDGKPNSDIISTPAPDQRSLPVNYPQGNGDRDLSTGCRVNGVWEDPAGNKTCCWGKKSTFNPDCTYYRFGCMCDKVLDKDGKEVN